MSFKIRIPQTSPRAGYQSRSKELDAAIARVLESGCYILGEEVAAFEAEFAAYIGLRHAIAVASGTDALALALRGLGIGIDDAVVTVSHTAVATVAAIEMVGAKPVLLDIEDKGFALDPTELDRALTCRARWGAPIRAVIPVHLYGEAADMARIVAIARRHGLKIIEDCSQAHGAKLGGRHVGTFGDVAAYSLYPTKNLGALGDGGIVATDDPTLAECIAAARQYGRRDRFVSDFPGVNSRLDELQAALLRVKLRYLDSDNERRRNIACAYDVGLADLRLVLPQRRPGADHVFHQYVVRTHNRDHMQHRLREYGVASSVHYPVPVHLQPAYRSRVSISPGGLRRTEKAAETVLSLPIFPQLSDNEVVEVCAAIRRIIDLRQ